MESETPEISAPNSMPLMPAVRAQIAELTPHFLSRCALLPLVLVVLILVLMTLTRLGRPEVEAVPSTLAHLVHFTLPGEISLAILLARPVALAITADLEAETCSPRRVSRVSITGRTGEYV